MYFPSTMEQASSSGGKKLTVDVPGVAGGEVKQEIEMEEADRVVAGAGKLAAVGVATTGVVEVMLSISKLHCPLCSFPLKPPIFQCDARHLACSACSGMIFDNRCYDCDRTGSYGRDLAFEDFLRSIRIPCPYNVYGCCATVPYCDSRDHRRACPCAPCSCPERERGGCRFVGSPAMLRRHIATEHPADNGSPVVVVRYGQEEKLALTAARRWHALVGEEDRSLFLVSLAAPCSDDTAVSLVCVRANDGGGAAPRYTCRLALELPGGGEMEQDEDDGGVVVMEFKVRSSALPGGTPVMDQRAFLGLHQKLQPGDTLALTVRIDRLQPVCVAAAAAGKSTAT